MSPQVLGAVVVACQRVLCCFFLKISCPEQGSVWLSMHSCCSNRPGTKGCEGIRQLPSPELTSLASWPWLTPRGHHEWWEQPPTSVQALQIYSLSLIVQTLAFFPFAPPHPCPTHILPFLPPGPVAQVFIPRVGSKAEMIPTYLAPLSSFIFPSLHTVCQPNP